MNDTDLMIAIVAMERAKKVHKLGLAAMAIIDAAEAEGDFAGVVVATLGLVRDVEAAFKETP